VTRLSFELGLLYDRYSERLGFDALVEHVTPQPIAVNEPFKVTGLEGTVPDIRFLVGTTNAGLLLIEGPMATRLFRGTDFFGISRRDGRWYAFQRWLSNGRIISFRLEGARAVDARTEMAGLSRGVHQIDFIDGSLWVVDTYLDRLLQVPEEAVGRGWRKVARKHFPAGRSGIGRGRSGHAHFNSIYRCMHGINIVAHNETVKTGRGSEILLLASDGRVLARRELGGACCHNIGILDGREVICRSWEGTVVVDDEEVLAVGSFLRGLALGPDYHLIGKSAFESRREARNAAEGGVIVTDREFRPLATVRLADTQVCEVRRVDVADLGISATPRADLDASALAHHEGRLHMATEPDACEDHDSFAASVP
jgi:hypothetical protein